MDCIYTSDFVEICKTKTVVFSSTNNWFEYQKAAHPTILTLSLILCFISGRQFPIKMEIKRFLCSRNSEFNVARLPKVCTRYSIKTLFFEQVSVRPVPLWSKQHPPWLLWAPLYQPLLSTSHCVSSGNPAAAAAAKLLQLCPTLCDPRDSSPPGSAIPGILQARTLEWVVISFSNAGKWKVKAMLLSLVRLLATP